jgi:hypothetical protein
MDLTTRTPDVLEFENQRVLSPQALQLANFYVRTTTIPTLFSMKCSKTAKCTGKIVITTEGVAYCTTHPQAHRGPDIIPDAFYAMFRAFDKEFVLTPRAVQPQPE